MASNCNCFFYLSDCPKTHKYLDMFFLQPCSMGFATGGKTFFLWGGCMMASSSYLLIKCCIFCTKLNFFSLTVLDCLQMHADDFRQDYCGVVSSLRDGGYSDDMTLAAIAGIYASVYLLLLFYYLFL